MIEFDITRDMDDLAHVVRCKAIFYAKEPLTIQHTGQTWQLRAILSPLYLGHLHTIIDDYVDFCKASANPLLKNEVARIIECQMWHLHGCHVSLANDLMEHRMEDLTEILPIDSSRDHAKHHLQFVIDTLKQFATERESLWVADKLIQTKKAA